MEKKNGMPDKNQNQQRRPGQTSGRGFERRAGQNGTKGGFRGTPQKGGKSGFRGVPAGSRNSRGPVKKPTEKPEVEGMPSRRLALRVIRQVTEQGAYASLALDTALNNMPKEVAQLVILPAPFP